MAIWEGYERIQEGRSIIVEFTIRCSAIFKESYGGKSFTRRFLSIHLLTDAIVKHCRVFRTHDLVGRGCCHQVIRQLSVQRSDFHFHSSAMPCNFLFNFHLNTFSLQKFLPMNHPNDISKFPNNQFARNQHPHCNSSTAPSPANIVLSDIITLLLLPNLSLFLAFFNLSIRLRDRIQKLCLHIACVGRVCSRIKRIVLFAQIQVLHGGTCCRNSILVGSRCSIVTVATIESRWFLNVLVSSVCSIAGVVRTDFRWFVEEVILFLPISSILPLSLFCLDVQVGLGWKTSVHHVPVPLDPSHINGDRSRWPGIMLLSDHLQILFRHCACIQDVAA